MALTDIDQDEDTRIEAITSATVYVCITCRRATDPEDAPRPGLALARATSRAAEGTGVTVRQIERVGDVLDRAIGAGANDVGGVQFDHADLSKTLDAARTAALADAHRKAEIYARAAGLTLGSVSWVIEEQANAPQPRVLGARMAASAGVPIAAGEDTLEVRVTVGFDVAH